VTEHQIEHQFTHWFLIDYGAKGVQLDAMAVFDIHKLAAALAADKLRAKTKGGYSHEVANMSRGLQLRARYKGGSDHNTYAIRCDTQLSMEELETILQCKQQEGSLQQFLAGAKI
jgi:hypothetical protein